MEFPSLLIWPVSILPVYFHFFFGGSWGGLKLHMTVLCLFLCMCMSASFISMSAQKNFVH